MRYSITILLLLLLGAPSMAGEWIHLIQKGGMKGWHGDTGTWKNFSEAWAAKDGSKKIDTSDEGSGILVNGPDGKTVNLFSEMEHGDLEAKIEFMVPPESNSGVYFMGRYEVQVLDSWGEENPT
ncbi:MAG: DUF1080 domain-containing protein, partial [Candidatus Omnitrophica bacterium]|nr:DUF1080 domain-containing protein [Candidatus Omnitrophota bacterium]